MYILALDTATNCGGIALSRNAEVIGQVMLKAPLRYSEEVLSCVEFLLEGLRLKRTQVGCFAVASGPGSFTGLRIGLATVKAFAQSLGRPAVGLSTLEALAFRFRWARSRIVPMIDARRQQIYGACYRIDPDTDVGVDLEVQEQVAPPAEFLRRVPPGDHLFVGDGAQQYRTTIQALHPGSRVASSDNCILPELCLLAHRRHMTGETGGERQLKANYLRPSDARIPSGARHLRHP